MFKLIRILTLFSASTLLLLVIFGLIFRSSLYWSLPVTPGEPYGIGDVLELVIYFSILAMASLNMLLGVLMLIVPSWRDIRLAIISLIVSLIMPPLYFMLHSLVPKLV